MPLQRYKNPETCKKNQKKKSFFDDFLFVFRFFEIFIYENGVSGADENLKPEYNLQR